MTLFWKVNVYKIELIQWNSFVEIINPLGHRLAVEAISLHPPPAVRLVLHRFLVSLRVIAKSTRRFRHPIARVNLPSLDELRGIIRAIVGRRDEIRRQVVARILRMNRNQVIEIDQIAGHQRFLPI